jgi:invasion protein IalB
MVMVRLAAFVIAGAALGALTPLTVHAQQAAPAAAPASSWVSSCGTKTRTAPLDCSMEQSIVKNDTRQLVASFSVRVPGDTRTPVLMIQLPLGLYLPGGLVLQVDQSKAVELPVQSCDANGCYAGAPLSKELLAQLQAGSTLHMSFQNLARTKIDIPMPLTGFGPIYAGIQ